MIVIHCAMPRQQEPLRTSGSDQPAHDHRVV
jgi:hypothetical protein